MIRAAKMEDWKGISKLLTQLCYPDTEFFIKDNMERLLIHPDEELMVYEDEGCIVACISIHFIPQLGIRRDTALISYLVVDSTIRSKGIGKKLEEFATASARKRGCESIQVHCHSRRIDAHRFYERQGYKEAPKYFSKRLDNDGSNTR
ncbi:GNAT family N-acetyltransferase [Paenibacillus polymyxa]|uniref:GNAT family N-acetyltransferase n=1 Tax=Paenibacillus polymyxa TaxID=1406 RepID=UPI00211D5485|nr:GNAT family N-acetyltransferase [Paenibacillus polymyxa]MEB4783996.1 GNAT family N-acetyltransferase [Paenibacillus jamilae]WOZ38973.1 GNAT family N-acetyltransferase [Paenibacillus polymyxa]